MSKVKIFVTLKEGILDVQGTTTLGALKSLGYENVSDVRIGKYVQLELDPDGDRDKQIQEMCDRLVTNPVIEDYTFEVVE